MRQTEGLFVAGVGDPWTPVDRAQNEANNETRVNSILASVHTEKRWVTWEKKAASFPAPSVSAPRTGSWLSSRGTEFGRATCSASPACR